MRIIAGQRRGHKIDGPRAAADLRPTSDLVRESLFNIVGPLLPGRLAIDLFAGTGAVGLEALSRGAARAIFVERNREAVGLIHRNIATLRYQDRASVRLADAHRWVRSFQPGDQDPIAVFLDPPYREYEVRRRTFQELIRALIEKLPAGSVIAVEAGRELDGAILPDFETWDVRRYGDTRLAILVKSGSTTASDGGPPLAELEAGTSGPRGEADV
jgi:16S rRNA (guanine966-N2)-methyltransferase